MKGSKMVDKKSSPGTVEERLHRLERIHIKRGVEFAVLERAVWSLILTHPDPGAFATRFREATERTTAIHLNDELVTDEVREASHQLAMEMVELALAEQRRRLGTAPKV